MREKKYLFEKLFNEDVDKSIKDLLELLLTERISAILQKRKALEDTQKDKQEIRFREWDRIVNEHCPG